MKPAVVFTWSILLCLANQTNACNYSFDPCSANMYRLDLEKSCGENGVMKCKTVQTSSFSTEYASDNAVDGISTTCSKPAFSLTDSWWWRVDLQEFRTVQNLSLMFNDSQTASNFSIYISNSTEQNNSNFLGMLCANQTISPGTKQTDVSCDKGGLVGRFVHVVFPQSVISLCEIEVFENKCRTCPNNMVVASGHNTQRDCHCPLGTYMANDMCQLCPLGKTTHEHRAAVQPSDCVLCASAYDPKDHSCTKCNIGFVKNKQTSECEKCPEYTFNNFAGEERCFDCMSWTETGQSCKKTITNSTSCPNLCKTVPGYQVTGIGSQNLEPCPQGYFNNDVDQMFCRECGVSASTNSIGSVNSSQCNVCNFRYYGRKCQYCSPGFQTMYIDGVCNKQQGVLIFLKVMLSIQGQTDEDINSHIQHAFSARFNITNLFFFNNNRRLLVSNNNEINITFQVQAEDSQVDVLQSEIVGEDMKSLSLYQGLSNVNISVISVDIITKITHISHNAGIIRFIVITAICTASLIFFYVLYKFWYQNSPAVNSSESGKPSMLTWLVDKMSMKIANKEKSYSPIQ